ncbi:MAG: NADH-quinone oxidoreductase subunit N [Candidatus Eremiobacteraeota bacterium]|nr:NADH-quinone oxidoreductase subunit N [Candidatus Eremiobacteraeota bacterium]
MLTNPYPLPDWQGVIPLFVVAVTALVVLFADLIAPKNAKREVAVGLGIAGLIVAAVLVARSYGVNHAAFIGGFVLGGFAVVMQEIILISAIVSLALYMHMSRDNRAAGVTALLLWSTSGAMLMAGAANLMTIFLGLELLSLSLYCLCGISLRRAAREAALKYLILSSAASGFMLFGMAMLFGTTGSVALASFADPALAHNALFWFGVGFFLVGIAFKLSLAPFHVWAPDVYEGAPLPVTAYMSVVTKAGTLAVLARFAYAALPPGATHALLLPLFVVAGISMIVGNLGMLAQTDIKRLLAYSGVAQIGYIVAALAGGTALGLRYAIFYLVAYMLMNFGAFAVAALLSTENEEGANISAFRALGTRRPLLAAAMTFFLLALAGLPPTAGFLGKILILSATVNAGYAWLGVLLIAGTAVSIYAYFKIVRLMYERQPAHEAGPSVRAPLAWISVAVCALIVVALTFYPITPSNVLPLVK